MAELDKIIDGCTECGICLEDCEFLSKYCESPKELAEQLDSGYFREKPMIPYSCSLCDLCEVVCPEELNMGRMCLEIREKMVEQGLGPLRSHKLVERDQEWVNSESFALALPDPATGECHRVFFPGCNLAGYSPSLVLQTYDYIRDRLPGTGIILGCCGSPTKGLGDRSQFVAILRRLESKVENMGCSEMILVCPHCISSLKSFGVGFHIRSLYEVLAEIGLPQNIEKDQRIFSLHDSCKARWEKELQEAVRTLVSMLGHQVDEMEYSREKARCCGVGGSVPFVNSNLSGSMTNRRAGEAHHDILTYCASCREAFARKKASLHILDLIFNPNWNEDRLKPPNGLGTKKQNQAALRSSLDERKK
ncbi:MAG: (Fe-S)-binding protein [Pseudomonadota bacterium]